MLHRPHPVSHRLLSVLLALLVLATSVGLTAERHRCRISGRSTVALSLPGRALPEADGCGRQQSARAKHRPSGCCDISHVLHKLDAQANAGSAAHWLPTPPAALPPALVPAPVWVGLASAAPLAASVAVGTAANSSPPGAPRAGRVLLARYCTLVV
ncbi:hypothetical protein [Hymenobacter psoromatis]|uniref:hypothetical protein n=1 Tax=Hymenobacter psoromatis TaxID=1484116 RepID=UPI001CBE035E|nr:hypothetical protein [Hymenobacter psoromatis]